MDSNGRCFMPVNVISAGVTLYDAIARSNGGTTTIYLIIAILVVIFKTCYDWKYQDIHN